MRQPQKEKPQDEERAKVVRQKRTWTYVDENGQDLGQDYLEKRQDDQENNVSFFSNILCAKLFLKPFIIITIRLLKMRVASV